MERSLNDVKQIIETFKQEINSMFKEFVKDLLLIKQNQKDMKQEIEKVFKEVKNQNEVKQKIDGLEKYSRVNATNIDMLTKKLEKIATEELLKKKIDEIQLKIDLSRNYQNPAITEAINSIDEKLERIQVNKAPENETIKLLTEQIAKLPVEIKRKTKTTENYSFWTVTPPENYLKK